jgi:serine/threonine-protein kinase
LSDDKRSIDEEHWDRGLKAVFGSGHVESVLESIERRTGATSRVLLHEPPTDESPLLRVPSLAPGKDRAEDDSRYHIVGEIARGGVGIVHKARDKDLGRDVALKLLRKEHADKPEVFERFIEEAQIGAQLQHPGIVPVYGLGLQPDRRPFFTMKLIKGQTLSALVKEREDPSENRRRFLAIFEQACQTMAYAHARGVIHRDLKPSNIMVGSFGEVQVVDWGFGKVLGRDDHAAERLAERTVVATVRSEHEGSHSIAGSVMGTPAYMPPEQALGHVEQLDERSDVFALGAILCEILTGKPPYTGRQSDLLVKAAQARLDEARERLASCGAGSELVALVSHCLMPVGGERPEHAGALANAISDHLAAAEDRARNAELDAIDKRARLKQQRKQAEWERSRKRRTRLVAAALLAAVVCGGGTYLWTDAQRLERAEAARPAIEDAMGEATRLKSRKRFGEALAMARKALDLAETGEVDDALRKRASMLVQDTDRALAASEAAKRKREEDVAFLRELEGIGLDRVDGLDLRSVDRRLEAAFRDRDIDIEADPPTEVAARIRRGFPNIAIDLAAALDEWAWGRRTQAALKALDWEGLVAVARAIDPDTWRNRLRDAIAADDVDQLRSLAAEALESDLPVRTLDLTGLALKHAGDREAAVSFYLEVVRSHPEDFLVNYHLSIFLGQIRPPRHDEAVRFSVAALALRPESPEAHVGLGNALAGTGRLDESVRRLRKAVGMEPHSARAHNDLGVALSKSGQTDEALASLREAVRLDPEDATAHGNVGTMLLRKGHADEALVSLREAVRLAPESASALATLGGAFESLGRYDDAAEACRRAIGFEPDYAMAHSNLGRVLLLTGELEEAVGAFRDAVRLGWNTADANANLGLALLHLGRDAEAVDALRLAIEKDPASAESHFNLGLVSERLGKLDEAADAYGEATRLRPDHAAAHNQLGVVLHAQGKLDAAIVAYREATRHGPKVAAVAHLNLGGIYGRRRDFDAALAELRKALQLRPDYAAAYEAMGFVFLERGDLDDALREMRKTVALRSQTPEGSGESALRVTRIERAIEMSRKLPLVLSGELEAEDVQVYLILAMANSAKHRHVTAARLYALALDRDPYLTGAVRKNAALAAMVAGDGECREGGEDFRQLPPDERRVWLDRSLNWLRAELAAYQEQAESDPARVLVELSGWSEKLAGLREEDAFARLSADDRGKWEAFVADLDALLEQVREAK